MDAQSPQSALIVRRPYTVVPYKSDPVNLGESSSQMVAVHGLQEPLDEDLRKPHASNTQRQNRVPVIVVSLWMPIPRILWLESTFCQRDSIHQSPFFCGRDACRQSPSTCENVAPPVEELQFDDVRRKVNNTFVTGRFAILVEMLCALLSSLLVTIYHPRRAKKRRGCQYGRAEGRLPREEGGDHCMPLRLGAVLQQGKKSVMWDGCDLSCTLEKDCVSHHRWLKSAEKECFSYMDTGNDTDDRGPNFMKNKLRGPVGLFDRLLPGCVSGWVYPVSRPRVTRAGTGPGPGTHPSPQPLSSADTQWPPDSMHDTPWSTFRQELYRFGTFLNLPQDFPVSPLRLAQAGFLRLANGSIVCFFCGLIRNEWSSHESPLAVHRQLRPDCPMMTGVSCDNVSVQSDDQPSQTMQRLPVQSGASQTPSRNGLPNGDVSEDGSARALQAGAQAGTTLGAAGGRPSGSVDQNASGASPQQARRQPPRLGLMGGAPSSATPGRPAILDGTAQPDPPAPEVQAPPRAEGDRQVVTYKDLGILTDSPRRPDMATVDSRLATYRECPDTRRPTPLQLVEAGLYYAGYSDCGRCFFCGGGLTNWEPTDDPWVAHARCFPTCGYVIQSQGHEFVNIVTELSAQTDRQSVSVAEVTEEITRRRVGDPSPDVRADPAVSSAIHSGFNQQAAEAAARRLLSQGQQLSVVSLMDVLEQDGAEAAAAESAAAISDDSPESFAQARGEVDALQAENSGLRQRDLCKICLDRPSSVVFLPCGHLSTCAACSPALRACPLCRLSIKGRVRAFPA